MHREAREAEDEGRTVRAVPTVDVLVCGLGFTEHKWRENLA